MFRNYQPLWMLFFVLVVKSNLLAQGYISPFKYDNGVIRIKSSGEIQREESQRKAAYRHYEYNSTSKRERKIAERNEVEKSEEIDPEQYRKYLAEKKREDSIKRVEAYLNAWKYSSYTSTAHYKLYESIEDMMNTLEYEQVDSITSVFREPLSSEYEQSTYWDHYRARLGNRMLIQYCAGMLDSAWVTMLRIRKADSLALSKLLYTAWSQPKDLELMKVFLLYESGAYDSALAVCEGFIGSLPAKDAFSLMFADMYCLQSRCLLALGKGKEAKQKLDEYMQKQDSSSIVIFKYNGLPESYISETYGLLFEQQGDRDSALYYYRGAARNSSERTGLKGYARNYDLPFFSFVTGKFKPPVPNAFFKTALLGGYNFDDPNDEGHICLLIASRLGVTKAGYILKNRIPWAAPPKPFAKQAAKPKATQKKKMQAP